MRIDRFEYEMLQRKLRDWKNKYYELYNNFDEKIKEREEQIENVCKSIQTEFNTYMKNLKAIYESNYERPLLTLRKYSNEAEGMLCTYMEIEIQPFKLKFVKNIKEDCIEDSEYKKYIQNLIFADIIEKVVEE